MRKIQNLLHHFFVPSERNNFRAKALHLDMLSYYLGFALILTLATTYLQPVSNILGVATDITTDKLFELTNKQRAQNGLSALTYNEELSVASQKKAEDMFAKDYWAHFAPDGTSPWDFMRAVGYRYEYAGENLAKNFMISQAVVDAWMNSQSHRENILRKEYTEVGYAVVNGVLNGEETTLVVQMFAKPLTTAPLGQAVEAEQPKTIAQTNLLSPTPELNLSQAPAGSSARVEPQAEVKAFNTTNKPFFSILNIDIIFFSFIFLAILLDLYLFTKMRVVRVGSKPLAHLIFIGFILAGIVMFVVKGSIM